MDVQLSDERIEQICRNAQLQVDEVTLAQQEYGSVLFDHQTLSDLQQAAQGLDGISAAARRRASETLLRPSFLPPIILELPLPAAETSDATLLLLRMELPRGYPLLVPPLLSVVCAAGHRSPAFILALGTTAAVREAARLRGSGVHSCLCELMEWGATTLAELLSTAAAPPKPKLTELIRLQQQREREQQLEPEPELQPEPETQPEPAADLLEEGEEAEMDANWRPEELVRQQEILTYLLQSDEQHHQSARAALERQHALIQHQLDRACTVESPQEAVDPELDEEAAAMIRVHAEAQLEHVRNAMVLGKRSGLDYRAWLQSSMPGDYHNEFVSECRKNERWHEMWSECDENEQLVHRYTAAGDNSIDVAAIDTVLRSGKPRSPGYDSDDYGTADEADETEPQHQSAAEPEPEPEPEPRRDFKDGSRVRIHGLQGAAHHNGAHGFVQRFDAAKRRYVVRISGLKKPLAVRPENLQAAAEHWQSAEPPPDVSTSASAATAGVVRSSRSGTSGCDDPVATERQFLLNTLADMMGGEVEQEVHEMVMRLTPDEVMAEISGDKEETVLDKFFTNKDV